MPTLVLGDFVSVSSLGKHMNLLRAAKRKNKNKVKEAKGCRHSVKVDRLKREVCA